MHETYQREPLAKTHKLGKYPLLMSTKYKTELLHLKVGFFIGGWLNQSQPFT